MLSYIFCYKAYRIFRSSLSS